MPFNGGRKNKKRKLIPQDTEEEQWKQIEEFPTYYISSLGRTFNYISQIYRKYKKNLSLMIKNKSYKRQTLDLMYKAFIGEIPVHHIIYSEEIKVEGLKLKETSSPRKIKLRATYNNMKHRCYNEASKDYKSYGAKGIRVEEDFNTFEKFFMWAIRNGYEPDKGLEIDRVDGTKNYTSSNCRWVTKEENILNQYNLTVDDVKWIRSDEFTIEEALKKLKCSEYTINNIRNYVSFKNI